MVAVENGDVRLAKNVPGAWPVKMSGETVPPGGRAAADTPGAGGRSDTLAARRPTANTGPIQLARFMTPPLSRALRLLSRYLAKTGRAGTPLLHNPPPSI